MHECYCSVEAFLGADRLAGRLAEIGDECVDLGRILYANRVGDGVSTPLGHSWAPFSLVAKGQFGLLARINAWKLDHFSSLPITRQRAIGESIPPCQISVNTWTSATRPVRRTTGCRVQSGPSGTQRPRGRHSPRRGRSATPRSLRGTSRGRAPASGSPRAHAGRCVRRRSSGPCCPACGGVRP